MKKKFIFSAFIGCLAVIGSVLTIFAYRGYGNDLSATTPNSSVESTSQSKVISNDNDEVQKKLEEQQKRIDELQAFKDQQETQENAQVQEELEQQQTQERVDTCKKKKAECERAVQGDIEPVRGLNFGPGAAGTIREVENKLEEISKLKRGWEKAIKECNSGSSKGSACVEPSYSTIKKDIEEAKDDIAKLEKAIEDENNKIDDLLEGECKNYQTSCE